MLRTVILSSFFLFIFTVNAQTDPRLNGLESELNSIMQTTMAPGFAVAVVEKDQVVFAQGFGYRD